MEKIMINVVESHLEKLPNSNMMPADNQVEVSHLEPGAHIGSEKISNTETVDVDLSVFLCLDTFSKSIENGFVIVISLNIYIECAMNTVIRNIINCHEDFFLRKNLLDKIQLLYFLRNKNFEELKNHHTYAYYRANNQIRNELVHFKDNFLSPGIPSDYSIGKYSISELFTKPKMQTHISHIYEFVEKIYSDLGLIINPKISTINATGFSYEMASYALEKDTFSELPYYESKGLG